MLASPNQGEVIQQEDQRENKTWPPNFTLLYKNVMYCNFSFLNENMLYIFEQKKKYEW